MNLLLENKRVLVTGSNRGTGQIIADAFRHEGANVIYHAPSPEEVPADRSDNFVVGDITTDIGAEQVKSQTLQQIDGLDVLVNNFGKAMPGNWRDATTQDWIDLYQINTLSIVRMTQAFLTLMPEGSSITNLGTIGSTRPNSNMPHYYAAKGALANLTVSLAKEMGPKGIRVNLISPGLIRTPEVEMGYLKRAQKEGWGDTFDEAEAKITEKYFPNPLGRIATREEVADLVVYIASQRASFVTGQNIRIDGGSVDIV